MNKIFKICYSIILITTTGKSIANNISLNVNGTLAGIYSKTKFDIYNDWSLRFQIKHNIHKNKIGLISKIEKLNILDYKVLPEIFLFKEINNIGRIELGLTNSVAYKLSLGISDVSGLNLNQDKLIYLYLNKTNKIISNGQISSGKNIFRLNIASKNINSLQYGLSLSTLSDQFSYLLDFGLKYKNSEEKLKIATSFAFSFIEKPKNLITDIFSKPVIAKSRTQVSLGLNLQYNSFIYSNTLRIIYDDLPTYSNDGIVLSHSISYNLLNYSISLTNILSNSGIWDKINYNIDNTTILSFRYKYNPNLNIWLSLGQSETNSFISSGIKISF